MMNFNENLIESWRIWSLKPKEQGNIVAWFFILSKKQKRNLSFYSQKAHGHGSSFSGGFYARLQKAVLL